MRYFKNIDQTGRNHFYKLIMDDPLDYCQAWEYWFASKRKWVKTLAPLPQQRKNLLTEITEKEAFIEIL